MAQHCGKHDIIFADGGTCWCCEDAALTKDQREKAYSDPEFLSKRGGTAIAAQAAQAHVAKVAGALSRLTPEQLDKLVNLVSAPSEAPVTTSTAGTPA